MDIKKEKLIAEIENFKTEILKIQVVKVWAESHSNSDPFKHVILEKEDCKVWWMEAQAHQLWETWLAAKAQAVPEGFVLVEKKNTEDWYLDDCEGMWWDHDGIDGSLCELDIGEVQDVEHKEYLITENNTLYATRVWDDANDQVDCWQFFKTKEEAEKAAAYCKAKFYEEAQEQNQ